MKLLSIKRLGVLTTRGPSPDRGSSLAELKPLPSPTAVVSGSVEAGSQRLKPLEDVTCGGREQRGEAVGD